MTWVNNFEHKEQVFALLYLYDTCSYFAKLQGMVELEMWIVNLSTFFYATIFILIQTYGGAQLLAK